MILSVDVWLLPAIAAASSSYLVSLIWEKVRPSTAPIGVVAGLLAGLSFLMGGISAYYRYSQFAPTLENNIIIMFVAGAFATFVWLAARRKPASPENGTKT